MLVDRQTLVFALVVATAFVSVLWLSLPSAGIAGGGEPTPDPEETREEPPDCTDPGNWGYPECDGHASTRANTHAHR